MKFPRLQVSIANNSDQEPSLYMALCMVESLFTDLEAHGHTDISQCPAGSELLPSKLIWLSRILNDIYETHGDELQRNRARLDKAMEKLADNRQKLVDLGDAAEKLAAIREENAALEQELLRQSESAGECQRLASRCATVREQLAVIKQFDPAAARAELETLNGEISRLEQTKADLAGRLERAKASAAALREETDAALKEEQTLTESCALLTGTLDRKQSAASRLKQQLEDQNSDCAALTVREQQLRQELTEATEKTDLLRKAVAQFRDESLSPKLAELAAVQKELDDLKTSVNTVGQEYETLSAQRNQLILEVAHQNEENNSLSEKNALLQTKLTSLRQEKAKGEASLSAALEQLEEAQAEVARLSGEKLPDATRLRDQEQQKQTELRESLEEVQTVLDATLADIARIQEALPRTEEALREERAVYESLTATYNASSKELNALREKIAELRNNKEEEKLEVYRQQLEARQAQLEAVTRECTQLEQENGRKEQALDRLLTRRDTLREQEKTHEEAIAAMEKQLEQLAFAGSDRYLKEIAGAHARLKLLEGASLKLSATINSMRKFLGREAFSESASTEERLKELLRDLALKTDTLRKDLLECAKSIKLEEQ